MFWVCVCSLIYPACRAHAPCYIAISSLFGFTMFFSHYVINSTTFGKGYPRIKCVLIFSTVSVRNISLSKKNSARCYHKYTHIGLHVNHPLFLSQFTETWLFSTGFRRTLKYKISFKSVQLEPSCSMRADRRI